MRGLLRRERGLEHSRRFGRGPGVQLGEYLRRTPRSHVRAAEYDVNPRDEPGEAAGYEPELLLALRGEGALAVVGPAVGVALEGRGVADEVESTRATNPLPSSPWPPGASSRACLSSEPGAARTRGSSPELGRVAE